MSHIKDFLSKLSNILEEKNQEKDLINSILNKNNINTQNKDLKIKNNILFLKINPYLKSEVLLNKDMILKDLNKNRVPIKDIRWF